MTLTLPWFFRKETRIHVQQSELPQRVSGARTRGGCRGCPGPGSQERSLGDSAGTTPLPGSGSLLSLCLFRLQPLDSAALGPPYPSVPPCHFPLDFLPCSNSAVSRLFPRPPPRTLLPHTYSTMSQTVLSSTHRRK